MSLYSAEDDRRYMAAALSLGRRGLGLSAPNPAVGALVVADGVIVGRGFTKAGGRPHAETEALRDAGALARGATLYVSLEPCSHHGRTAPCADAIIAAGVRRVVSALDDPDPRVCGSGHVRLRAAGVEVAVGVLAEAARLANLGHFLRMTQARPMVTLKLAETADGYAAGDQHDPRLMITSQAADARVHVMRAMHDAIMVGIGTVNIDDPLMTVRLPGLESRHPLRIVLDTTLSLPLRSRLVATARGHPTLVIAADDRPKPAEHLLAERGVEILRVVKDVHDHVDLDCALKSLAARGLTRVLSEGGPRVARSLIECGLADEVMIFTAPKRLGREGVPALDAAARAILADGARFLRQPDRMVGPDRLTHFRRIG